jgi:glucosamine-6-phosphate deaminase
MTVGLGTLLESDQIVLIVSGASKAEILQRTLEGPVSQDVPATYLRAAGSRLVVLADRDAASLLNRAPGQ